MPSSVPTLSARKACTYLLEAFGSGPMVVLPHALNKEQVMTTSNTVLSMKRTRRTVFQCTPVEHLPSYKWSGTMSTLRPFGKAFYLGMAKGYRVWSLTQIVVFTIFNRVGQIIFHLLPILGAIEFGAVLLYTDHPLKDMYRKFYIWIH